jgi:hypothetical protein
MKNVNTFDLNSLIEQMNKFSAEATSDTVSVHVARIADKLSKFDGSNKTQLSDQDLRIIQLFTKRKKVA